MAEINASDEGNTVVVDHINTVFNKIESYISSYSPGQTDSPYAILSVSDMTLTKGSKYTLENKPMRHTTIFGLTGISYVKVGYLDIDGVFHVTEDYSSEGTGTSYTIYQLYRRQM